MEPERIAERVWPGRELVVEQLGGGITNHNFKVTAHGEAFVLRIGGKDTELLGINRDGEHAASLAAAALGVGPEVIAFVEPEGYLVTRFVEGRPLPLQDARKPEMLRRIAETLRRVHEGSAFPAASTPSASSRRIWRSRMSAESPSRTAIGARSRLPTRSKAPAAHTPSARATTTS